MDAADYFRHAREAMGKARRRIMLIGWDFDARIRLDPEDGSADGQQPLGEFLYGLVQRNPELDVFLLRWDVGALRILFRGNNLRTLLKWMRHPRIHTKLDGMHPPTGAHAVSHRSH